MRILIKDREFKVTYRLVEIVEIQREGQKEYISSNAEFGAIEVVHWVEQMGSLINVACESIDQRVQNSLVNAEGPGVAEFVETLIKSW